MTHLDPRRGGDVTASDVAAICGENQWSSRHSVLFKKVFHITGEDSAATIHGRTYEPIAIDEFCKRTGATVDQPGYVKHKKYTWFGGTVDGIATMHKEVKLNGITIPKDTVLVIEVKCPLTRQIKDEVPGQYIGQIQSYMEILDMENLIFVQFKPPGPRSQMKFSMVAVKRDRTYMALRMPVLRKFWDDIQIWGAYATRVVLVIQRAWRMYLARRAFNRAAKENMRNRLACANTVGKIAGFLTKKKMDTIQAAALMESCERAYNTIFVDITEFVTCQTGRKYGGGGGFKRIPKTSAMPVQTGDCYVCI